MLVAVVILQVLILMGIVGALTYLFSVIHDIKVLNKFIDSAVTSLMQSITVTHTSVTSVHKRIDAIFSVDPPQENQISKNNIQGEELSEDNFINQVPSDLKFEIEGGDSQIPPAYWNKPNGTGGAK